MLDPLLFDAPEELSGKVLIDGKLVNALFPKESLLSRLESVWGNGITDSLVSIDQPKAGPLEVKGYVSKPETNRSNRTEIFFFVNQRPVLEKAFFGALIASYGHSIPPGRHPYAAVFLDIDPAFVDINVHPAKTEVRFADDGFIFTTLKKALDKALALPVSFAFRTPPPTATPNQPVGSIPHSGVRQESFDVSSFSMKQSSPAQFRSIDVPHAQPAPEMVQDSFLQIFETYIIIRQKDALLILDQHTAHERILFEKTLNGFATHGTPSQRLLFEERMRLTHQETSLVEELGPMLAGAGFEIRSFGPEEVIISGLPQEMAGQAPVAASVSDARPKAAPGPLRPAALETIGGAVPLDSEFYVTRPVDGELQTGISRRRKPCIITWPAIVPTEEDESPDANSESANTKLAAGPSKGSRVR